MARLSVFSFGLALCCTACAAHSGSPTTEHATVTRRAGETCSSMAQSGVSASAVAHLGKASNVIEYENIWKSENPGTTTGSISGGAVRSRIRAKLAEVQGCYQSALDRSSDGRGRVVVRFVIDPSGHVSVANIGSNSFGEPEVSCCVVQHVARWTFPKPAAGGFVVVEYPFVVSISHGS